MSDLRKAAEMALEFVDWLCGDDHSVKPKNKALNVRDALRQALAQPERGNSSPNYPISESITTFVDAVNMSQECVDETAKCVHDALIQGRGFMLDGKRIDPTDFYKQEPKREWVGLTHEERDEIDQICRSQMEALFVVEEKLKEKNT